MIEELLKERIGLHIESVGRGKLDADVARRMDACGLKSLADYERLLSESSVEFERLVELATIPETWFFRAYDSFVYLEEFIREEWLPTLLGDRRILRVMSMPCSTGEEPYSIAMSLLRSGLPRGLFKIDAFDLNERNLEKARKGVFGKNSFRGGLQWFKDLHFTAADGRYALHDEVRDCVSFHKLNIFELPAMPEPDSLYDIVFCRNLLIYFDEAGQRRALDLLGAQLKEGGLLFLGHAEASSLLMGRPFAPIAAQGSFAFKKIKPQAVASPWDPTDTQKLLKVFRAGMRDSSREPAKKPSPVRIVSSSGATAAPAARRLEPRPETGQLLRPMPDFPSKAHDALARAKSLADRGLLVEAEILCREHIAKNKLDPDAYFLLGILLLGLKRHAEAEGCLNKTLFLKPDHSDALLRLAAIKEGRGDSRGAELCRRRARRGEALNG